MMIPLPTCEYVRVRPLLEALPFNGWMARSVVDGLVPGEVWVDSPEPRSAYVRHPYGMAFLAGTSPDSRYTEAVLGRCAVPPSREWLQAWPDSWNQRIRALGSQGPKEDLRLNFRLHPSEVPLPEPETPGLRVEPLDAQAVWNWEGTVVPRFFWSRPEDLVRAGGGFGAWVDGVLASVAFAAYGDGRVLEIGVETKEGYRGRGLARRAAGALVRWCLDRGLEAVWACRESNQASTRTAVALGFRRTLTIPYWTLVPRERVPS